VKFQELIGMMGMIGAFLSSQGFPKNYNWKFYPSSTIKYPSWKASQNVFKELFRRPSPLRPCHHHRRCHPCHHHHPCLPTQGNRTSPMKAVDGTWPTRYYNSTAKLRDNSRFTLLLKLTTLIRMPSFVIFALYPCSIPTALWIVGMSSVVCVHGGNMIMKDFVVVESPFKVVQKSVNTHCRRKGPIGFWMMMARVLQPFELPCPVASCDGN